ncbi:hypothetical protein [Luteolibacter sp. AS25]|uniref:hypothetical protein n=1 Tax=Luteolibacter sp. AS25 TaxID=3135776 RepID=UPI00398B1F86
METIVCTLFEKVYHHGVAALANSLYASGFRGDMCVGYRGPLPPWVSDPEPSDELKWEGATSFRAANGLRLLFLPLETNFHLANFKAEFMREIISRSSQKIRGLFYMDPDIVVTAKWECFERWLSVGGVVGVENDWSPIPVTHPRRLEWIKYYKEFGRELNPKSDIYVNSGIVGVLCENLDFIELWEAMSHEMSPAIGGLENCAALHTGPVLPIYDCFSAPDQDAMNAAIDAYPKVVSVMGKEFMGMKPGFCGAPHALGSPKPWSQEFFRRYFLTGYRPTIADVGFWENASGPISSLPSKLISRKLLAMKIIRFLARFYRRS